jgi:hypothetical protein
LIVTVDYRTAAQRCALCNMEKDAHTLRDLIGLACCEGCIDGDLDRAAKHWGFVVNKEFTPSGYRRTARFFIEIKRPTFIEAFAKFDTDSGPKKGWFSRMFKRDDPQVGDKAFDDQVLIAPDRGADEATLRLLEHEGVRACVLELIRQGAIVDLTGNSVWVHDDDTGTHYKFANMEEALPYAMALAVHIERIAQ